MIYTTHLGIIQDKVNIFFTINELEMLRHLSTQTNTPIGCLLVELAHAHRIHLDLTQ